MYKNTIFQLVVDFVVFVITCLLDNVAFLKGEIGFVLLMGIEHLHVNFLIQVPDGIRLHVVSVFVAELGNVIDDKVQKNHLLRTAPFNSLHVNY